jgi:hypothetical protein
MLIRSNVVVVAIYDHEEDYVNLIQRIKTKYEIVPIDKGTIVFVHELSFKEFEQEFIESIST